MNMSSLEVYYNKDLFDKAHVPYPKAGWTWDDFVNDAKAITNLSTPDEKITAWALTRNLSASRPSLGRTAANRGRPRPSTHLTLDTPAAKEAFQWFVDLQMKYHVVASQDERSLRAGRDALPVQHARYVAPKPPRGACPAHKQRLHMGRGAAARGQDDSWSILHTDAYCIAKASKNKDLAWKFVEYANGPVGQI